MNSRLWVGGVLTLLVVIVSMSDRIPGHPFAAQIGLPNLDWVELAFATPVVLWVGWPLLLRAKQSLERRRPNALALCSMGALAAWLYSVAVTILTSWSAARGIGTGGLERVPVFDVAALITMIGVAYERVDALLRRARQGSSMGKTR